MTIPSLTESLSDRKRITPERDGRTLEYRAEFELDGAWQLIGYFPSYYEAERALDAHAYQLLQDGLIGPADLHTDPEADWAAYDAALCARCHCYALGIEQQQCLAHNHCCGERGCPPPEPPYAALSDAAGPGMDYDDLPTDAPGDDGPDGPEAEPDDSDSRIAGLAAYVARTYAEVLANWGAFVAAAGALPCEGLEHHCGAPAAHRVILSGPDYTRTPAYLTMDLCDTCYATWESWQQDSQATVEAERQAVMDARRAEVTGLSTAELRRRYIARTGDTTPPRWRRQTWVEGEVLAALNAHMAHEVETAIHYTDLAQDGPIPLTVNNDASHLLPMLRQWREAPLPVPDAAKETSRHAA